MNETSVPHPTFTIGIDVSDRYSQVCVLDSAGRIVDEPRFRTTPEDLAKQFRRRQRARIALEVGTHAAWMARLLQEWGHEVIVANARVLALIFADHTKTDRVDARKLARVARFDPALLHPIRLRRRDTQAHLAVLRSREVLVRTRTRLVNHVRGVLKSFGLRVPGTSTRTFAGRARPLVPTDLQEALAGLLHQLDLVQAQIYRCDAQVERIAREQYPETERLRQVNGVGPLTSLAFVLTLEDPARFPRSRWVAAFLGLRPRMHESGERHPPQRITKAGDAHLRGYLVNAAQYILGPFGRDSDLRRFGFRIQARGGKYAKGRAVVAVARKLAVLLHRLWVTGAPYEPLRHPTAAEQAA